MCQRRWLFFSVYGCISKSSPRHGIRSYSVVDLFQWYIFWWFLESAVCWQYHYLRTHQISFWERRSSHSASTPVVTIEQYASKWQQDSNPECRLLWTSRYHRPGHLWRYRHPPSGFHYTFLGLNADKTLTFSEHTTNAASKCNSRLHLKRQLRQMGMNSEGLLAFYKINVKAVISYAAPAWFRFISENNKRKFASIQRAATRIILPETDSYTTRPDKQNLPTVSEFLFDVCASHFSEIVKDPNHPHCNRVIFNTFRTSSRRTAKFYPGKCRTETYRNRFFQFFYESS